MSCTIEQCNLLECMATIEGKEPSSASRSDQWLVTFHPNTRIVTDNFQQNGQEVERIIEPIESSFVKFFISASSFRAIAQSIQKTQNDVHAFAIGPQGRSDRARLGFLFHFLRLFLLNPDPFTDARLDSLSYEARFYRFVTEPLRRYNICPHFVPSYGTAKCRLSDLLAQIAPASQPQLTKQIERAVMQLLYAFKRTALTDVIDPIDDVMLQLFETLPRLKDEVSVSYLLTENMAGAVTLDSYLKNAVGVQYHGFHYAALFQVAFACYALFLAEAAHNDLHGNNVFVSALDDRSQNFVYQVVDGNGVTSNFEFREVSIFAQLFDYDFSYARQLGPNPLLNARKIINDLPGANMCEEFAVCNQAIPGRDFIKVLSSVAPHLNLDEIIPLFSLPDHVDFWRRVFNYGGFLIDPVTRKPVPPLDFVQKTYSYTEILARFHQKYLDVIGGAEPLEENESVFTFTLDQPQIRQLISQSINIFQEFERFEASAAGAEAREREAREEAAEKAASLLAKRAASRAGFGSRRQSPAATPSSRTASRVSSDEVAASGDNSDEVPGTQSRTSS